MNIQYILPEYSITQLNLYIYGEGVLDEIVDKNCFIMANSDEQYEKFIESCYKVQMDGKIYVWVYGEELKQELEQQGIRFESGVTGTKTTFVEYANSFRYTPIDSSNYRKCFRVIGNNSSYGASWYYLGTDGYMFSDPIKLSTGEYCVEVTGENLDASFMIADSTGKEVDLSYSTEETSGKIIYSFNIQSDLQDARLYIRSNASATLVDEEIMKVKRVRLYSK